MPNTIWKSKAINAIICPQLHTDLILGLNFLSKNKIVVDANLCTIIEKSTGYDLLNPPDPTLNKKHPLVSPYQLHREQQCLLRMGQEQCWKLRNHIHLELKMFFDKNPKCFDMDAHTMGPTCIIAAVQMWITELATMAELLHLNGSFKTKYKDHFPTDIPHVCDLPMDVYHCIELQPGAPVSVA